MGSIKMLHRFDWKEIADFSYLKKYDVLNTIFVKNLFGFLLIMNLKKSLSDYCPERKVKYKSYKQT